MVVLWCRLMCLQSSNVKHVILRDVEKFENLKENFSFGGKKLKIWIYYIFTKEWIWQSKMKI